MNLFAAVGLYIITVLAEIAGCYAVQANAVWAKLMSRICQVVPSSNE